MVRLSAEEYARHWAGALSKSIPGFPEDSFVAIVLRNLRRMKFKEHEDLVSLVALECLGEADTRPNEGATPKLDAAEIGRRADKVRHRLVRLAHRNWRHGQLPADALVAKPESIELSRIRRFMNTLSLDEVGLFEDRFLNGLKVAMIAHRRGISQSATYERLNHLKHRFRAFLSEREF